MEKILFSIMFTNNTITNPINKNEVFTCGDFYKDYNECRKLAKQGKRSVASCSQFRVLGRQCYFSSVEDFEKLLTRRFDEKRKFIEHLKQEDSLLYHIYLNDPTAFSISFNSMADQEIVSEVNKNIIN